MIETSGQPRLEQRASRLFVVVLMFGTVDFEAQAQIARGIDGTGRRLPARVRFSHRAMTDPFMANAVFCSGADSLSSVGRASLSDCSFV